MLRQRELKLRRDMYDLAAERARAASLEAELKYLKASAGPATVAYQIVQVPDVEPALLATSPTLAAIVVHRSDTSQALTSQPHTYATHDDVGIQRTSVDSDVLNTRFEQLIADLPPPPTFCRYAAYSVALY